MNGTEQPTAEEAAPVVVEKRKAADLDQFDKYLAAYQILVCAAVME